MYGVPTLTYAVLSSMNMRARTHKMLRLG